MPICQEFLKSSLVYVAVSAPYRIGFGVDACSTWMAWERAIDGIFLLVVPLNFCTSFLTSSDVEVFDHSRIALNYLKGWFWIDVSCSLPWDAITAPGGELWDTLVPACGAVSTSGGTQAVKAAKLLKIGRILKACKVLRPTSLNHL